MSSLSVYLHSNPDIPDKVLTHFEDIAATLEEVGVRFERLPKVVIEAEIHAEELPSACYATVEQLKSAHGYASAEWLDVSRKHPQWEALRQTMLDEQCQEAVGARWFVAGRGLLNLHIGERVYALQCERNDLVATPAGTRYWLDIGEFPELQLVSLSEHPQGWQANPTGDDSAARFPRLDD